MSEDQLLISMSKMTIDNDSTNIKYLTPEQVKSKEAEHGFVWMAFFRFTDDKYVCDGIKVKGKWQGKGKSFPTWEEANAYLETNRYNVKYIESPLDGMAIAHNQGVIGVYLRTKHPKLAKILAKKAGVESLRFARLNRTGTGFIGWDPDRHRRETRTYTIDPSNGVKLIGEKGKNAIEFRSKTGCTFVVKGDKVFLTGLDTQMEVAETHLKNMMGSFIPTPALLEGVAPAPIPHLTGWAKMAQQSADKPVTSTPVKVVVGTSKTPSVSAPVKAPVVKTREVFPLPEGTKMGHLIGVKGSHLRALIKFTGCEIEVVNGLEDAPPSLVIFNTSEEVRHKCFQTVQDFLASFDDEDVTCPLPLYSFDVHCPSGSVGKVMGTKGKNLQELRKKTKCQIRFDDQSNVFTVSSFTRSFAEKGINELRLAVIKATEPKTTSVATSQKKEKKAQGNTFSALAFDDDDEE